MEGLGVAANVIAVVDLSAKVASICLQYSKDVKNARDEIMRVEKELNTLKYVASGASDLLEGPQGAKLETSHQLLGAVVSARSRLEQLQDELNPRSTRKAMSRLGLRALKWPFQSKDVKNIIQEIARCTQTISTGLQIDQTSILLNLEQKVILDKLPIAPNASFDSHAEEHNATCLPATRVELLERIHEWVEDSHAKPVFWLNGMAGTGKSTISRTIARSLAEKAQLGASFFFKRGEGDRGSMSKFFPTIASQLTNTLPALASHIKRAIDDDSIIATKALREQFEKLILSPLSELQVNGYTSSPIAIVVDALDECERDDDIRLVIKLLSRVRALRAPGLKVFLTSRPELPIRLGFNEVKGSYQDLILHEIPPPIIERDIQSFFEHELLRIRKIYNNSVSKERQLPESWPGHPQIQTLVNMAVPLFIFAATACRFLSQRGFGGPNHQLRLILDYKARVQSSELELASKFELTYQPALNQQLVDLSPTETEKAVKQFRYIVGTIIILSSPLSTTALGHLLDVPRQVIDDRLDMLHSVLSVPKDSKSPVRLLHLSFRDYVLDITQRERNPFWVDEKQSHYNLAEKCLSTMQKSLHEDICDLRSPGTLRSTIDSDRVDTCVPPEVKYACLYWAYHVQEASSEAMLASSIYRFLSRYLLYWLEALSLIGKVSESLAILRTLQPSVKDDKFILEFVDDAIRFIRSHIFMINTAPLQLYSSALVFTPQKSLVRQAFEKDIPAWISLRPVPEMDWNQCIQRLEGHGNAITSVAFSHDSALVASASLDKTVRLWQTSTGDCVQLLKGHNEPVTSVAFSHDSTLVASSSYDGTEQHGVIRLWQTDTGDCIRELKGHSKGSSSAAFSHDSAFVASASDDCTVLLWQTDTGDCTQKLKGHRRAVTSVAFSHDSALVASGSYDGTIRLWQLDTGNCVRELQFPSTFVSSVAFSHDSALIASASYDDTEAYGMVRLWQTDTGDCVQELHGMVTSIAFSHDSSLLASNSGDGTIRLWKTDTGDCIQKLKGHGEEFSSVAFSHDSALIASASSDETVRLWRTDIDNYMQESQSHGSWVGPTSKDETVRRRRTDTSDCVEEPQVQSGSIKLVIFSYDSALIASVSDEAVWLWQNETGKCIQKLQGYGTIGSVAFSYNSALLVFASANGILRLWRPDTGDCVQELQGHDDWICLLAFSHDSALIASVSRDNTVQVWRPDTGECIQKLQGHDDFVGSASFSHDSALIASASHDRTVRLWKTDTGECVLELQGHDDWVSSVAFSHDSTLIASASYDRTVRLWKPDTGDCVQQAHIGTAYDHLSFAIGDTHVITDAGAISIENRISDATLLDSGPQHQDSLPDEFRISPDRCWITLGGQNLLWLPVEFRLSLSAIEGSTVVLGCNSGRVIIMRFSVELLEQLSENQFS